MKRVLIALLVVSCIFTYACTKETTSESGLQQEMYSIKETLEKEPELKIFSTYMDHLDLSVNNESGLTILAIKDKIIHTKGNLSVNVFKRHILSGFFDLYSSSPNILVSLSRDSLFVSQMGKSIFLNGISVSRVIRCSHSVIYVVDDIIPEQSSFQHQTMTTITVREYNQNCSSDDIISSTIVENAVVQVYEKDNDRYIPKFYLFSDKNGKVSFSHANKDLYYTIHSDNASCFHAGYQVLGIYKSEDELKTPVPLPGTTIGSLKFKDANGDNIINKNDRVNHCKLESKPNEPYNLDVYIAPFNYVNNFQKEKEIESLKISFESNFELFSNLDVNLDFQLTNISELTRLKVYQNLLRNVIASKLWGLGYKLILDEIELSLSLKDNSYLSEKYKNLHENIILKTGLVYSVLTKYFGNIPIMRDLQSQNKRETIGNIITNFESYYVNFSKENAVILSALLASFYLNQNNFQKALEYSMNVVNSERYSLFYKPNESQNNSDVIIGGYNNIEKTNSIIDVPFIHPLRFEEIILITAECYYRMNNKSMSKKYLNMVLNNKRLSLVEEENELESILFQQQSESLGLTFVTAKRWGVFLELYSPYGAKSFNALLPIPSSAVLAGVEQNPGY